MYATPHNRGHDEPLTILDVVVQDKNSQCTSFKKYQDYQSSHFINYIFENLFMFIY
jgi:hypothetical protein